MRKYLLILLNCLFFYSAFGQTCSDDFVSVVIRVETDKWAENSWSLGSADSLYTRVDRTDYSGKEIFLDTFCIPAHECLTFTIYDGFGDGITEGGSFEIYVDSQLLIKENEFGLVANIEVNCQAGTSCVQALEIQEGNFTAPRKDSWYSFTPDTIGTYTISTCDTRNECDTRIWVYDRCESFVPGESEGFIFFDDNTGNCGFLALVNAYFNAGQTYYIRISDTENDCGSDSIYWSLNYRGPVIGCTDPNSCNFNPLATVDDGSCLPQDDPRCPNGPDFDIREDVLRSSIFVDTIFNDDDCLIAEGCLKGFGLREILRFTTRFENIGELDYYIGEPSLGNSQFTFDNCHNHFHYANYAEYLIFDASGNRIPGGFKSGFCVIDLICTKGNNKYGCANMGLTAGCFDEYGSDLDCQWLDVTDIPDGEITFVARVNWNNQPDALGRVEKNLLNNWAQVCLTLDRSSGKLEITINEDCNIISDCEGNLYGNAVPDCEGICGGQKLVGDIDGSSKQTMQDVQSYVSMILEEDSAVTPCNDLNADEELTIYDAALLADCINFGAGHNHPSQGLHNHCEFPAGILNTFDTVGLVISAINTAEKYVDISIKNETVDVVAFQFKMEGIQIKSLQSLVDIQQYPTMLQANIGSGEVIGISLQNKTIPKSRIYQPLIRIAFQDFTENFICLKEITDIVNQDYQQVITKIDNSCIDIISDTEDILLKQFVKVQPNPFRNTTMISFSNPNYAKHVLIINDLAGKTVKQLNNITSESVEINSNGLENGVYFFQVIGEEKILTGKLIVQ